MTDEQITLALADDSGPGHWITMNGEHVEISGSSITKGPASLTAEDHEKLASKHARASVKARKEGREDDSYAHNAKVAEHHEAAQKMRSGKVAALPGNATASPAKTKQLTHDDILHEGHELATEKHANSGGHVPVADIESAIRDKHGDAAASQVAGKIHEMRSAGKLRAVDHDSSGKTTKVGELAQASTPSPYQPMKNMPSHDELMNTIHDVNENPNIAKHGVAGSDLIHVKDIRDAVAAKHGAEAASHKNLDPALKALRASGKLRMVESGDRGNFTPAQHKSAVPGNLGNSYTTIGQLAPRSQNGHTALSAMSAALALDAHSYASTHVVLPKPIAEKMRAFGSRISPDDLHEDGVEKNPHITVKYGLHYNSADLVKDALKEEMPVKFRMNGLHVFPANEKRNSDVLVSKVDSPDMHRLNTKVAGSAPHVDTFPTYEPHATIAYLKPGMGAKYAGMKDLDGIEGIADEVVHSDRNAEETRIPLKATHRLPMSADEESGHWVTIDGAHVEIKGGVITKGPSHLVGRSTKDHARIKTDTAHAASGQAAGVKTHAMHDAAAKAHSEAASAALANGDKKSWEHHADAAFEHHAHGSEGWRDPETGKEKTGKPASAGYHEEKAKEQAGKSATHAANGDRESAKTSGRFSDNHQGIADEKNGKKVSAKDASARAETKSYMTTVGKGDYAEHADAAKAHKQAAKAHAEAGNKNDAAYHENAASHHERQSKPVTRAAHQKYAAAKKTVALSAIILDAHDLDPSKEVPGGLEGLPTFEEIDDDKIVSTNTDGSPVFAKRKIPVAYYWKEIARTPGDGKLWTHRAKIAASGNPFEFDISRDDMEDMIRNFKDRDAAGIKPFIPDSHTTTLDAKSNNGHVIDLKRQGNKLMAKLKIVGAAAQEKTLKNDVSVYLVDGSDQLVVDARGKQYKGRVLHHVALTPNPALPHLGKFERIAASAESVAPDVPVFTYGNPLSAPRARSHKMTPELVKQARQRLGLAAEIPDDEIEDKIAEKAIALSADLSTLTVERDTAREEVKTVKADHAAKALALSANDPTNASPLSLSLISRAMRTERDQVIASGALSEAGMKEIDLLMIADGKPTGTALALSAGSTDPFYIRLCDILRRNPGIKTANGTARSDAVIALSSNDADKAGLQAEVAQLRQLAHLPQPK